MDMLEIRFNEPFNTIPTKKRMVNFTNWDNKLDSRLYILHMTKAKIQQITFSYSENITDEC